jgi:polyphosphate kinase 2 (PPK2 family)
MRTKPYEPGALKNAVKKLEDRKSRIDEMAKNSARKQKKGFLWRIWSWLS